ncbi:MAG: hypothetical protein PHW50_01800 [Patescibacteria group bacterium]|nr:hypothetical protein [Patescibacteria group bacterium]
MPKQKKQPVTQVLVPPIDENTSLEIIIFINEEFLAELLEKTQFLYDDNIDSQQAKERSLLSKMHDHFFAPAWPYTRTDGLTPSELGIGHKPCYATRIAKKINIYVPHDLFLNQIFLTQLLRIIKSFAKDLERCRQDFCIRFSTDCNTSKIYILKFYPHNTKSGANYLVQQTNRT